MSCVTRSPVVRSGALLLAVALVGCSVVDSTVLNHAVPYAGTGPACKSALGSYSLPRAYVRVVIEQQLPKPPVMKITAPKAGDRETLEIVRRPDSTLTVCLDYLSSAFAHDKIEVIKDVANTATTPEGSQFLGAVIVNAADRSSQILRTLIRALFVGLSGDANFVPEPIDRAGDEATAPLTLTDVHYDPFDAHETAKVNAQIARLGYCMVLDGFSYNDRTLTVDQYCSAPYSALDQRGMPIAAELYEAMAREPVPANVDGIIYRPRQNYLISVYRKLDSRGSRPWALERRVAVDLENLSPVLSIKLPRAPFATRAAALVFNKGVLHTACVLKTSEVENFVVVPYEVVRSIVALPSRVFQVKIDQATKSQELVTAETRLYAIQQAHLKALQTQQYQSPQGVDKPKALTPVNNIVSDWPAELEKQLPVPEFKDDFFQQLCQGPAS